MNLDTLPKNVLYGLALDLKPKELYKLCLTNKKLDELICNNDNFWKEKLYKDYPETIGVFNFTYKGLFKRLYERTYKALFRFRDFEELNKSFKLHIVDWDLFTEFIINIKQITTFFNNEVNNEYLIIEMYPKINTHDKDSDDAITKSYQVEMRMIFNMSKFEQKIYDRYRKRGNFPTQIPASAILKYFDPLLLKKLEDLNIPIVTYEEENRKIIDFNTKLKVKFVTFNFNLL